MTAPRTRPRIVTDGLPTALVVPSAEPGAVSSWRRMVTAVDPRRGGAFALEGRPLPPGTAWQLPTGAIVVACDRLDGHRLVRMLRAEIGGLQEVKAWDLKAPLGKRVVDYIARRLPDGSDSHCAVQLESVPNRYPGRCAACRQTVPASAGLMAQVPGGGWRVTHRNGQCPAPPLAIEPNRYSGPCFACGSWVEAYTAVAIRKDRPDEATGSWYAPIHKGPCPAGGTPGPLNRAAGWCADCGEHVPADGGGYWLDDALHHRNACPDPTMSGPTWAIRRRGWMVGFRAGQIRRIQVDLRHGGADVPGDAPGRRVLSPTYIEFIAAVVETVDYADGGQRARVRPATGAEAEDLLASDVGAALDAMPTAGFKARFGVERILPTPHEARIRVQFLGLSPHVSPWLAEIVGRDPDFRWDRRFLHPDRDWRDADKKGRGVRFYWTLTCGRVYQAAWRADRKHTVRAYLRATPDGDVVEIGREEVTAWLNTAPVWPAT